MICVNDVLNQLWSFLQLRFGHWHHAAHVPGSVVHLRGLPDHQRSGSGEGAPSEGGSADCGGSKLFHVVLLVYREHGSDDHPLCFNLADGEG